MGRVSFGGAQDLSGVFASIYGTYLGEQRVLAERAERRAKEVQAAGDRDAVDRWQSGAMTDAEFQAYAQQRITETQASDEPDLYQYWTETLRNFEENVLSETISLEIERLTDEIAEGRATWDDMLTYLNAQRAQLESSHPLYNQIGEQIGQVRDRQRDARIGGEFEQITYLFESDQITGAEAGRRLRELADKYYLNTDQETYYKVLQQAGELERFGGLASSGRRSSGGGGGGGGGGAMSDTEAMRFYAGLLEGQNAALRGVLNQANQGASTATFTYTGSDGELVTGQWPILGPDGTADPEAYQTLQTALLDNFDQMITVYNDLCLTTRIKSDCNTAGQLSTTRGEVIAGFQAFNTTQAEIQGNLLFNDVLDAMNNVLTNPDPVDAWTDVVRASTRLDTWNTGLTATVERITGRKISGVDIGADETVTPLSEEDLATAQFTTASAAMNEAMRLISNDRVLTATEAARVRELLGPFFPADQIEGILDIADTASSMQQGILKGDGSWIQVYAADPNDGIKKLVWLPTEDRANSSTIDPDGNVVTSTRKIVTVPQLQPDGSWDDVDYDLDDQLPPVAIDIDGKPTLVRSPLETVYFGRDLGGARAGVEAGAWYEISADEYNTFAADDPASVMTRQRVTLTDPYGKGEVFWYQNPSGMWVRVGGGRSAPAGTPAVDLSGDPVGVPIPYSGLNPRQMQAEANKAGLDQTGTAYWNPAAYRSRAHDPGEAIPGQRRRATGVTAGADIPGLYGGRTVTAASLLAQQGPRGDDDLGQGDWYTVNNRFHREQSLNRRRQLIGVDIGTPPRPPSIADAALRLVQMTQTTNRGEGDFGVGRTPVISTPPAIVTMPPIPAAPRLPSIPSLPSTRVATDTRQAARIAPPPLIKPPVVSTSGSTLPKSVTRGRTI